MSLLVLLSSHAARSCSKLRPSTAHALVAKSAAMWALAEAVEIGPGGLCCCGDGAGSASIPRRRKSRRGAARPCAPSP
eukprot:9519617-Heterocapsa_arctica.AAC.1